MFPMRAFVNEANRLMKDAGIDGVVEPAKEGFGDYTFPCFPLARKLKKSPVEIASELAKKIGTSEYFEKIESVGPYLNFHINPVKLAEITIKSVVDGSIFHFEKKEKIILEHTSANPTGPLHVGRARNPIIGDTMARILREYGHDVKVHYFVNDAGMQVATLLWGILNLNTDENIKKCDHRYVLNYQKASAMLSDPKVEGEVRNLMKKYEGGDEKLRKIAKEKIGCVLNGINETLKRINVIVDEFIWESEFIEDAKRVAEKLKRYTGYEDGAYYLKMSELGANLQKDKFYLYRKDGTTLYFLRDIAYHLYKGKNADFLVDVLGEDHKLHFEAIKMVMKLLNPNIRMEPIFYSFVRLPEGKMSTRKGTVVYLDELLDEGFRKAIEILENRNYEKEESRHIAESIAYSSIRYALLNVQLDKPIVFRWDKALNFEGESAPFIIYTHARASSILRKGEFEGTYYPELLKHPEEIKLLKLIAKYPNVIEQSARSLSPYYLARYAYELAFQFNQFYRDCPVLNAESSELKKSRLALVFAFKNVLSRTLKTLGIEPLEKM